ncbi:LLM class flavin-dependent oxidoreductase [Gordonia paraffinivorans]|uniref:Alkanesulfonate monooxygenase n=1 Tax=Gordonia paraffinivorans NBRC 108238 TaxID=1223543 RepID=A0ABQ0IGK5_9ACTN|nr:LLM class flavin-dependent oxidoreductase [Gordonia paraffinivorans]GAC82473.1 alkanesulfonate monooxygenase [Gordonia paraffinivorans NBRC 108238]
MSHFHWFLPTAGDSRGIVGASHASATKRHPPGYRAPELPYLIDVARAADRLGYESVLTPTGTWCEDAWLTTAAAITHTRQLTFLVAFRPGLISPTLAAQQAATLQRFSGGRVAVNIVTGGDEVEQRRFGDWEDHDRRYARTAEFLEIVERLWDGETVDFDGEFYRIAGAFLADPPETRPRIFFGGSSDPALTVAAQHAEVYLTWGEPPAVAGAKIAEVARRAAAEGRTLEYGVRLHVIARETSEEAWRVADALLADITDDEIATAFALHSRSDSTGQRRMAELHGGRRDALEIHPGLWAGVGLIRGGAGTALVGSHAEVASLIGEYEAQGFSHFILSGYPHVEEAHWFAEGVLPVLRDRVGALA